MLNGMVFIERQDKMRRKTEASPFARPVANNNLGVVKYSDTPGLEAGTEVYFGGQHETIQVEGAEVLAMKADNILAKVLGPGHEQV